MIEIECDKGHIFSMSFNNFKKGQRCPKCARENQDRVPKKPNNKKHSQEFIKELVESRGYKLLEPYVNKRTKLKLMCPKGHIHEIRLDSFQNGSGCKQCMIDNMKHDISFVIKQLEKREFKLLSKYEGNNKNIVIQCKHGHIFSTTYDIIVNNNCGCPICNESKGEKKINNFLTKYKIKFNRQYKFENCKFYRCLPFDFSIQRPVVGLVSCGERRFQKEATCQKSTYEFVGFVKKSRRPSWHLLTKMDFQRYSFPY